MAQSPRNKTGTFLGMESNIEELPVVAPPKQLKPKIAPLQVGRGRYARTSTEVSRHKKVEAIREKETYRGFTGLSLNTAQRPKTSPAACHYARKVNDRTDTPTTEDITELTRRNPRKFTAVNNHGVAHREYLTYSQETSENSSSVPADLAASLLQSAGVTGPTQYYNTLCQNNPEALKTLLSNKKFGWPTNQYTGFHIRSYRKPPTAIILADLDQTAITPQYRRPKTALSVSNKELLVPQPYIYRSVSNAAKRVGFKSARPAVESQPISFSEEVADMFSGNERSLNPSPEQASKEQSAAASEIPGAAQTSDLIGRFDQAMPLMKKSLATKDSMSDTKDIITSTPKINIAIETDDGNVQPPVIDEIEEHFRKDEESQVEEPTSEEPPVRRHSITDRMQKIKLGEDLANSIKIEAEQRKKALENLLAEHETLVKQIVSADTKQETVSH